MKLICRMGDETLPVTVERHGAGYRVTVGERAYVVDHAVANQRLRSLALDDGSQYLVTHHSDGVRHEVGFADRSIHLELFDPLAMKRRRREDEGDDQASHVRAIMPGRVVKLFVAAGDEVTKGQGLLILEAMKMENEITSPRDGRVAQIAAAPGAAVESGDDLIILE